jgi:hypothetical protein
MNRPEMNEIEAALAAWTPRAPQLDRDRLMFAAGEASRSPTISSPVPWAGRSPLRHLWPLATSLSTAAALFMAFLLAQDRGTDTPIRSAPPIASAQSEVAPQIDRTPTRWELPDISDGTYFALRNQMLTRPADHWTSYVTNEDYRDNTTAVEDDAARVAPTSRSLLREFLPPESKPGRRDPIESPAAQTESSQEAIS